MGLYDYGQGSLYQDDVTGPALDQSSYGALARRQQDPLAEYLSNPTNRAMLGMAMGFLKAGGASPYPVGLAQAFGQGLEGGTNAYDATQKFNAEQRMAAYRGALLEQQARKARLDSDLTQQIMGGGLSSAQMQNPDFLDALGARLAAAGHPGAATIIGQAEKMRAAQANRAAVQNFRSAPGTLGAGVTTSSPQGQAILANANTGDADFDSAVLRAQNEALNSNTRLAPQPIQAPNPGLFGPLLNSPYVGAYARAQQDLLNKTGGAGLTAQQWTAERDKLHQLHQTAANQAQAREETGALRRDIADQASADRRMTRDNTRDQRTFTQERELANDYGRLTKDFRAVKPHVNAAAQYIHGGKYDSAGDRALAFQYAKILDPQDRVGVNDIKDINKLGNVPERVTQAVVGLAEGKMLPDRIRSEMFQVIRNRFLSMNEQQREIEQEYEDRAKRYMINPSNVVQRYSINQQPRGAGGGWGIREKREQ